MPMQRRPRVCGTTVMDGIRKSSQSRRFDPPGRLLPVDPDKQTFRRRVGMSDTGAEVIRDEIIQHMSPWGQTFGLPGEGVICLGVHGW
jgi:hypothetical protein